MTEVGHLVYFYEGEKCMPLAFRKYLSVKMIKSFSYHSSTLSSNLSGDKKEENHFQKISMFSKW